MSEILADAGIAHTVCVATEYGEIVMREQTESTKAMQTAGQPIVNLHCGRMDREQMQKFLHDEGYEIVVDATHPYARVVTENLRGAVDTLKSLEKDDLLELLQRAITTDHILKERTIELKETTAMLRYSGGDARKLLNILDLVVSSEARDPVVITDEMVTERLQQNPLAYDKDGAL